MNPILVITHLASPYQVELFNALEESRPGRVFVLYLYDTSAHRHWQAQQIRHEHFVINDKPERARQAEELIRNARMVVFNFYNHPITLRLLRRRAASSKPWCFWGERTGYHSKGWPGRAYRRWRLSPLHRSRAPIWGMGRLAVEQYRREFGRGRCCFNLAYYSDLERFASSVRSGRATPGVTTFLYSGSLIHRKGVDLLAEAFSRLAARLPDIRLRLLGDGELRGRIETQLQPIYKQVEFLGFRDWNQLPEVYREADILCAPSRHDGWGLVVPEGLASGLPVISTNATGAAVELLQPRRNGWLVPAGDDAALERAMEDAASISDSNWLSLSRAARESAVSRDLPAGVAAFTAAAEATLRHWEKIEG